LSDDDEAGKKVVGRSSDEATVVTMLNKSEGFFNLPWKDNVNVYAHVYRHLVESKHLVVR
jgi:hypothetical protein